MDCVTMRNRDWRISDRTRRCSNNWVSTAQGGLSKNYFGNNNVIVTFGGEGVKDHDVIILWVGKHLLTLHVRIVFFSSS